MTHDKKLSKLVKELESKVRPDNLHPHCLEIKTQTFKNQA